MIQQPKGPEAEGVKGQTMPRSKSGVSEITSSSSDEEKKRLIEDDFTPARDSSIATKENGPDLAALAILDRSDEDEPPKINKDNVSVSKSPSEITVSQHPFSCQQCVTNTHPYSGHKTSVPTYLKNHGLNVTNYMSPTSVSPTKFHQLSFTN